MDRQGELTAEQRRAIWPEGGKSALYSRFGAPVATLTGKELGEFGDDVTALRDAAREVYRGLQAGPPARHATLGDVTFTRAGWDEMRKTGADPRKWRLVPALRQIIEGGEVKGEQLITKPRRDGIVKFYWLEADVELAGQILRVGVSIGEDALGRKFYNLNQDLTAWAEKYEAPGIPRGIKAGLQGPAARGTEETKIQGREPSGKDDASPKRSLIPSADGINIAIGAVQPAQLGESKLSDADKAKVKEKLRAILRQLAPKANLAFVDDLVDGIGTGKYLRGLVTVSLGYDNPEVTLRHEAIHALREMGLFDAKEWATLERAVRGSDILRRVEADEYYSKQPKSVQLEEAIAQMFGEFRAGKAMLPRYRRIFAKVRDFLTRFANALRGLGFTSAESIFAKVERGEVGRRETWANQLSREVDSTMSGPRYAAAAPMDKQVSVIEVARRFAGMPFVAARRAARRWAMSNIRGIYDNADQGWRISLDGGGIEKGHKRLAYA